jgi:hypothetical protein
VAGWVRLSDKDQVEGANLTTARDGTITLTALSPEVRDLLRP